MRPPSGPLPQPSSTVFFSGIAVELKEFKNVEKPSAAWQPVHEKIVDTPNPTHRMASDLGRVYRFDEETAIPDVLNCAGILCQEPGPCGRVFFNEEFRRCLVRDNLATTITNGSRQGSMDGRRPLSLAKVAGGQRSNRRPFWNGCEA
ncbi:MAG: hypothetical protein JNK93_07505 [Planctomycetia bacterium]|nr:hypothetical protein [Planctomycetia bacterium]